MEFIIGKGKSVSEKFTHDVKFNAFKFCLP